MAAHPAVPPSEGPVAGPAVAELGRPALHAASVFERGTGRVLKDDDARDALLEGVGVVGYWVMVMMVMMMGYGG